MPTMIENLESLLAQGQDSAQLRFALASRYLAEGEPKKACEHARVAVEFDADYSAAWRLLGRALGAAGDTDAAADAYDRGIEVAERRGDRQVAREMQVFRRRLEKNRNKEAGDEE